MYESRGRVSTHIAFVWDENGLMNFFKKNLNVC